MSRLTLLTVSRCEPYTQRFFTHFRAVADILGVPWVLACDRCEPPQYPAADRTTTVSCKTTIEDVLASVHQACDTPWVLRLDDDETLTAGSIEWLAKWLRAAEPAGVNGIAMARANLWESERTRLNEDGLWPDLQIRLVRREHETRTVLHEGLGAELISPCVILHHKFLVKNYDERVEVAKRYEATWEGAGLGEHYVRFTLPERLFGDSPKIVSVG